MYHFRTRPCTSTSAPVLVRIPKTDSHGMLASHSLIHSLSVPTNHALPFVHCQRSVITHFAHSLTVSAHKSVGVVRSLLTRSFVRSFVCSFVRSFVRSLLRCHSAKATNEGTKERRNVERLRRAFVRSHSFVRSFVRSLPHCFH